MTRHGDNAALASADLRDGLPAVVGLLALFVADAVIGGWAFVVVAAVITAAALGTTIYRDRTPAGRARRAARRRWEATLDDTGRRALRVVRFVPVAVAVLVGASAGDGVDIQAFAATMLVGFVVAQGLFVAWVTRRRPEAQA